MNAKLIESLETRRLLAANFDPATGILTVTGTTKNDTIAFANNGATFDVVETPSGQASTTTTFDTLPVKQININPGDGRDTVIVGKMTIPCLINGGRGNDSLSAGRGNDTIRGGGGDDYIFGSDGRDFIDGGSEGDDIFGGAGKDTLDYSARTAPLTIGLGTLPDDGEAGEGDNIRTDIEVVFGGSGSDNFSTKSGRPVEFYGNAGNDTILGGSGADLLSGGLGNDSLVGQGGNDRFLANDGLADSIRGGSGTDTAETDSEDDIRDVP